MSAASKVARSRRLELPDGSSLEFEIQPSMRSKSVRLKLSARKGLVIVVPQGVPVNKAMSLVSARADWIAEKLAGFDQVRHLLTKTTPGRPEALDLPALAESWRIEYRATRAGTVAAKTEQLGRIVVSGAVDDPLRCHAALRRWLARRARETLIPWLARVSTEIGLSYSDATIKSQRTRWGSCSRQQRISLNSKLLFLPRELVRYVLVHELSHTLVSNHSSHFWMTLRGYEPQTDSLHGRMLDAWKLVPSWALSPLSPPFEAVSPVAQSRP